MFDVNRTYVWRINETNQTILFWTYIIINNQGRSLHGVQNILIKKKKEIPMSPRQNTQATGLIIDIDKHVYGAAANIQ